MTARRALLASVAGLGVVGLSLAAAGAADAVPSSDYTVTVTSIGTSSSAPWTASSATAATVVDDGDGGRALRISDGAVTHHFATDAYPLIDNTYTSGLPALNLFSGATNDQVDPATGATLQPAAEATLRLRAASGTPTLQVELGVGYSSTGETIDSSVLLTCAIALTADWSTYDLNDCSSLAQDDGDAMNWKPTTDWTFVPSWGGSPSTVTAGSYVSIFVGSPATTVPQSLGFRVTGGSADIDTLHVRDQLIDFAAADTAVSVIPGASVLGEDASLTASVTPSTATGTVRILDGSTMLGEGPVVGGRFALTAPALAAGAHTLTAQFVPDGDAYSASTSAAAVWTVNVKSAPAAPPVADTAGLDALIADRGLDVDATTASFTGAPSSLDALDPGTPFSGALPWSNSSDSFVDVYAYSTPIHLGTFPVVNGAVQLTGVDLSGLEAGGHHLVFVGQTSASVQVMAVTIAETLAATGVNPSLPILFGALLLLSGIAVYAWTRRPTSRAWHGTAVHRTARHRP